MALKIYDAFPGKKEAQDCAKDMRALGVQFVQVRPVSQGRLKYGVYLGGKNSRMYV